GRQHVVYDAWQVTMLQGHRKIVATGKLTWVPGPSPLPWVALATLLVVAGVGAGLVGRWGPALGAAIVVLIAADAAHVVGLGFAAAGPVATQLGKALANGFFS